MDTTQTLSNGEVITFTGIYTRLQPAGYRKFNVRGPKADAIRELALVGGLSRKQIATQVGCSVSRVAEVLWGLAHDNVEVNVPSKAAPTVSPAELDAAILADAAE